MRPRSCGLAGDERATGEVKPRGDFRTSSLRSLELTLGATPRPPDRRDVGPVTPGQQGPARESDERGGLTLQLEELGTGMTYQDKTLNCRECGTPFIFTAGEQSFFAEKGLLNEPQRCPNCRAAKRARERAAGAPVTPVREMHSITCAQCGVETTVPFLPRNGRPVYCSSCYEQVRQAPPVAQL